MKLLVTGVAGFIGSHVAKKLLDDGHDIVGLDNLNDYYDPALKNARLDFLRPYKAFKFFKLDLEDIKGVETLFKTERPNRVMHLAAQAGVRYSVTHPHVYASSNLLGFLNILEGCRHHQIEHLVYASTSSVYGLSTRMPFSEHDDAEHPVSLYGATKRANELMAHSYSHMFNLPTTGLRFFTVYGPWGRPDMALFLFTRNILAGRPIQVFNYGNHKRDFTYIDDIVEGLVRVLTAKPASPSPLWNSKNPDRAISSAPFRVYNIGNNTPVHLGKYIEVLEQCLDRAAIRENLPMQLGDVAETQADVTELWQQTGFKPSTQIEVGVRKFTDWYRYFYKV